MAVKDRLIALNMSTLDGGADDDDNSPTLWQKINIKDAEKEYHLGEFFEHIDNVQQLISSIEDTVKDVKTKHNEILADPTTDNKLVKELAALESKIKKISNKTRSSLLLVKQDLENMHMVDSRSVHGANYRIRLAQYNSLTKRYKEVMSMYNEAQLTHRQKCKERIQRQLSIAGRDTTDEQVEEMIECGNVHVFTQGIIMDTQVAKAMLADIEARHCDIIKLESSIRELHEIFVDMSLLVEYQGELVDRIENNVGEAARNVESGRDKIKSTKRYRDRWRKKRMCLFGVLVVIISVVLLVIIIPSVLSAR